MSQEHSLQRLLERVDALVENHLKLQTAYQQLTEQNQQLIEQRNQACATIEGIVARIDALEHGNDL